MFWEFSPWKHDRPGLLRPCKLQLLLFDTLFALLPNLFASTICRAGLEQSLTHPVEKNQALIASNILFYPISDSTFEKLAKPLCASSVPMANSFFQPASISLHIS